MSEPSDTYRLQIRFQWYLILVLAMAVAFWVTLLYHDNTLLKRRIDALELIATEAAKP
jgi:hypothetical protein